MAVSAVTFGEWGRVEVLVTESSYALLSQLWVSSHQYHGKSSFFDLYSQREHEPWTWSSVSACATDLRVVYGGSTDQGHEQGPWPHYNHIPRHGHGPWRLHGPWISTRISSFNTAWGSEPQIPKWPLGAAQIIEVFWGGPIQKMICSSSWISYPCSETG